MEGPELFFMEEEDNYEGLDGLGLLWMEEDNDDYS